MSCFNSRVLLRSKLRLLGLAIVFCVANAFGLMHGVLHASPNAATYNSLIRSTTTIDRADTVSISEFEALWAKHPAKGSKCLLYDGLAENTALPSIPILVFALALPIAVPQFFRKNLVVRWVALFHARGPPLSC